MMRPTDGECDHVQELENFINAQMKIQVVHKLIIYQKNHIQQKCIENSDSYEKNTNKKLRYIQKNESDFSGST